MANVSGTITQFAPDLALLFDESFERAGIAPEAIGQGHIDSALRSTQFMLNSEWHTLGIRQWMIQDGTFTTVQGSNEWTMPVGAIDMFDAVLLRNGASTPINRMSPAEYLEIPVKTQTGRPDRYYVQRMYNACNVFLWRTPENSTDQIIYKFFQQMDVPGVMSNSLQMPPHVVEAFCSGLSAKLALKFNPAKYQLLNGIYLGPAMDPTNPKGMLGAALMEDRDRSDVQLTIKRHTRGGSR